MIKVSPDQKLENDVITVGSILNNNDFNMLLDPFRTNLDISQISQNKGIIFGNMNVSTNNPLDPPPDVDKSMIAYGNIKSILDNFTQEKACEEAITFFNNDEMQKSNSGSYVQEVKTIFTRFQLLIKRKAFLERRIHRFLKEYSKYLLPNYKNCYFEKDLFLEQKKRVADFILERESGLPPILVELESPIHNVFKKNLEFTAEVNHAKNQIAEWVQFIENDPIRNASGEFSFLSGPKERLVIIGRGLDYREN